VASKAGSSALLILKTVSEHDPRLIGTIRLLLKDLEETGRDLNELRTRLIVRENYIPWLGREANKMKAIISD
jgi:hypothetical protein